MSKLRRHDWRSHREIECNICGEILGSRQDISNHRKMKNQIVKRQICKFYPECVDGDECFFVHKNTNEGEPSSGRPFNFLCPAGKQCSDQSCQFSEQNHRDINEISCRFQENCNRANCLFKHEVQRKSFLERGAQSIKRK